MTYHHKTGAKEEEKKLSFKNIIFDKNNWEEYQQKYQPPQYVIDAVEKMAKCRTGALGYHYWLCEKCGYGGKAPHSCKSKLCSSCATIATKNWLADVLPTLLDMKHFQIVFTLPPDLRRIFSANKKILYNLFFKIASETILSVAREKYNFIPGIIWRFSSLWI